MLLGGLWHGAAWRFVVWGGFHAFLLLLERVLKAWFRDVAWTRYLCTQLLLAVSTFICVCFAWVFFRATDLPAALALLKTMLLPDDFGYRLGSIRMGAAVTLIGWLLASHWFLRDRALKEVWTHLPWPLQSAILAVMLLGIACAPGDDRAFIYFQF